MEQEKIPVCGTMAIREIMDKMTLEEKEKFDKELSEDFERLTEEALSKRDPNDNGSLFL